MIDRSRFRLLLPAVLACAWLAMATDARAQAYVSPLVGVNFGGDSGCLEISQIADCENRQWNYGVAFGAMGNMVGIEQEIAYAHHFFGDAPGLSSSVLTVMTSMVVGPDLRVVRPYVLFGLGLIKTDIDFSPSSLIGFGSSEFGWNIGGGLSIFFGRHFGIRGDVRYFHTFTSVDPIVIESTGEILGGSKLDFGRAAGALVFQF
jgi:opacity protein-like surface antigen